jgi:type IV pilus biogenesis protein CpaD/CtpE
MLKRTIGMTIGGIALLLAGCGDFQPTKTVGAKKTCPDWSSNPIANHSNADFSNLGCATNNNLLVQVKNPDDLKRGNGKAAIDAARDSVAVQSYLSGTGSSASSASATSSSASTSR